METENKDITSKQADTKQAENAKAQLEASRADLVDHKAQQRLLSQIKVMEKSHAERLAKALKTDPNAVASQSYIARHDDGNFEYVFDGKKLDDDRLDIIKGTLPDDWPLHKLPRLFGKEVLLRMENPKEKVGNVYLPDGAIDDQRVHIAFGTVVFMAPGAYRDIRTGKYFPIYEHNHPVPGDRVAIAKYHGMKILVRPKDRADWAAFIIIEDNEVVCITDPDVEVQTYEKVSA